jgi:hypothetical protein
MIKRILSLSFAFVMACDRGVEAPPSLSMEIRRIENVLGLQWPYKMLRVSSYRDGGSIGGSIRDDRGHELEFSWDGGLRFRPEDAARMGTRFGKTAPVDSGPRLGYIGADHPAKQGARPVLVRSPEESALVDVLRLAAAGSFPLADQDSVVAIWMDFDPQSDRHEMSRRLSESQRNAIEALRLAALLREQRAGRPLPRWR